MLIRTNKVIDDVLKASGISGSELARRLGVSQVQIPKAKGRELGLTLGYIQQLVGAAGYRLELHIFEKVKSKKKKK